MPPHLAPAPRTRPRPAPARHVLRATVWRRRAPGALDLAAGLVVVVGVGAQLARPLAPDLGPVPDPTAYFDPAFLARVEDYRAPLRVAAVARVLLAVAVPLLIAATAPGRRATATLVRRVGPARPARAAAVVTLAVLVLTDLVTLPLSFWSGFVHEGVWGFRTQGLGGWAGDWLAVRAPGWLGIAGAVGGGVVLVRRAPRTWPAVAGLAGAAFTVIAVFAAPLVIEPLTAELTPLGDGPVRTEVERVLDRAGEQIDTLLVADASSRTTKENAYVSGLGATRRVVLYDTLVTGQTPREAAAVLAHELAHDRNGDLPRGVAAGAAGAVLVAYAIAALLGRRAQRTPPSGGRRTAVADPLAVPAVLALVAALTVASLPVQTLLSRRAEAAADWGALAVTGDPATFAASMRGLAEGNYSDPAPPWFARLLWSTHPTPTARLHMADRAAAGDGQP